MIYVDSSVALARMFGEKRAPPPAFWAEPLVSSRLLEYETWNRMHVHALARTRGAELRRLLAHVRLMELVPSVIARALEPFPVAVRTLDALHLATLEYVRSQAKDVALATYDARLTAAARALHIPLFPL